MTDLKSERKNPSATEVLTAYRERDAAAQREQDLEARIFAVGPANVDSDLLELYAQAKDERAKLSLKAAELYMASDESQKLEITRQWKATKEGERKAGGVKTFSRASALAFAKAFPIVLAMPGAGKTTVVKALNASFEDEPGRRPALDLDIRGPKGRDQPAVLAEALSFYVRSAVAARVSVFSFLNYFEWVGVPSVPTFIFVPDDEAVPAWIERIKMRDGPESGFSKEAESHFAQWQKDWVREADRLKQQGRPVTLVRMNENEYLLDAMERIYHE